MRISAGQFARDIRFADRDNYVIAAGMGLRLGAHFNAETARRRGETQRKILVLDRAVKIATAGVPKGQTFGVNKPGTLSDEVLNNESDTSQDRTKGLPALFTIRHILVGVGLAGAGVVVLGSGWVSETPQTTEARQIEAQSDETSSETPAETAAETPADSPAPPTPSAGPGEEKSAAIPAQAPDPKKDVTNEQADELLTPPPLPPAPHWVVSFAQENGPAAGAIANNANNSSVERYLTWAQIDELDEIAETLPNDVADWLTIECAPDPESHTFAKEIHEVFSIRHRIKALNRATEPMGRGVFVMASGQTDSHFHYAESIAQVLNAPESPVHLGPAKERKPGIVRIVIREAEAVSAADQTRRAGK